MKRTWQKEKTHIHTLRDEYTAAPEDLSKLNFPLLPFPIFHLPQHRRTCRGKNNAHHICATLHFLNSCCDIWIYLREQTTNLYTIPQFPLLSSHSFYFKSDSLSTFIPKFPKSKLISKFAFPSLLSFIWCSAVDQHPGRNKCRSSGQTCLLRCPNYMGQSQLPCGQPRHFLG